LRDYLDLGGSTAYANAANIRSDNGVPFASAHALFNLSKLAVWWLRLGIGIERIEPDSPQQNGRNERMHLTLKKAPAARLASTNLSMSSTTSVPMKRSEAI
jgi:putative transposase